MNNIISWVNFWKMAATADDSFDLDEGFSVEDQIRQLVVSMDPKYIKKLLLTRHQLKILNFIEDEMTSAELAGLLSTSIQNASQHLRWLSQKGYLTCDDKVSKTGGYYHVYTRVVLV
jgi:DNA-binding CsgD family transcriptional regulator